MARPDQLFIPRQAYSAGLDLTLADAIYNLAAFSNPGAVASKNQLTPTAITSGSAIRLYTNNLAFPVLLYARLQVPSTGIVQYLLLGKSEARTTAALAQMVKGDYAPEGAILLVPGEEAWADYTASDAGSHNVLWAAIPLTGRPAVGLSSGG